MGGWITFAVFGDSVSDGRGATSWSRAYPRLVVTALESAGACVKQLGFAAGGFTSEDARRLLLEPAIRSGQPDVVVVCLGLNDQKPVPRHLRRLRLARDPAVPARRYEANVGHIVDELQRHAGSTVVIVSPPALYPERNAPYREAARIVAERKEAAFADLGEIWTPELIADDGAHPSDAGHRLIATSVLTALERFDGVVSGPAKGLTLKLRNAPASADASRSAQHDN